MRVRKSLRLETGFSASLPSSRVDCLCSGSEPVLVPRAFPSSDVTLTQAIPEVVAPERSAAANARGDASASSAAFAVGYESVQQFTREYGRMFGLPPVRDVEAAKRLVEAAA
jgi:hypothetical protein